MSDDKVRVFVAIELPEEARGYLARLQRDAQAAVPKGVRWVRPEGIHLTLKFLGSVPASLLPKVEMAISVGCQNVGSFSLMLSHVGVFPSKSRARVLWIGVGGDVDALARLQSEVDAALEKLGFGREARPFAAHLTLGRVEEAGPAEVRRKVGGLVDQVQVSPMGPFRVEAVSLMRSKLTPGGAIYSRLASIGL